jgi:hypothetical protein
MGWVKMSMGYVLPITHYPFAGNKQDFKLAWIFFA